jgi:Tfp pilus assembly PilM family ATPase
MAGESLGKVVTIVAMGRDQVQLKLLELPPAPRDELPEMVRFQAERDLAGVTAETDLDYVPLGGNEHDPHRVLAVALAADGMATARATSKSFGTQPAHVSLRALGAVSLLRRSVSFDQERVALLAVPLAEQAELIVIADGQPVLMRTVRLPEPTDEGGAPSSTDAAALQGPPTDASLQGMIAVGLNRRDATLACEIRRTLAASHQQLGSRSVEVIYLAGGGSQAGARNSLLSRQLRLPCETFDPLDVLAASNISGGEDLLEVNEPGRLVGVLGLALDAAEDKRLAIDFLHPRRPPEKATVQRVHMLAAATALVIVAAMGWWLYDQLARTSAELADLRNEIEERQQSIEQFAQFEEQAGEIEGWLAGDVNWLDELERLSRMWRPEPLDSDDFSASDDAVMTELTVVGGTSKTLEIGEMGISAVGRSDAAVPQLEDRLRDAAHRVTGLNIEHDDSVPGYTSSFKMDVDVFPSEDDDLPSEDATGGSAG